MLLLFFFGDDQKYGFIFFIGDVVVYDNKKKCSIIYVLNHFVLWRVSYIYIYIYIINLYNFKTIWWKKYVQYVQRVILLDQKHFSRVITYVIQFVLIYFVVMYNLVQFVIKKKTIAHVGILFYKTFASWDQIYINSIINAYTNRDFYF